jgi:hypothetical protein
MACADNRPDLLTAMIRMSPTVDGPTILNGDLAGGNAGVNHGEPLQSSVGVNQRALPAGDTHWTMPAVRLKIIG